MFLFFNFILQDVQRLTKQSVFVSRSIGQCSPGHVTEPHLTGKNCMECKECVAPNVMMTSLFFRCSCFFKEEMVQRHETEQRNHGSRVPWVLAENCVMIDDC